MAIVILGDSQGIFSSLWVSLSLSPTPLLPPSTSLYHSETQMGKEERQCGEDVKERENM